MARIGDEGARPEHIALRLPDRGPGDGQHLFEQGRSRGIVRGREVGAEHGGKFLERVDGVVRERLRNAFGAPRPL